MLDVFHAVSRWQSQPRRIKWGEENHEGDPLTSPDCVSRYGKSPSPARGGSHRPSGPEPTLQSRRCVCSQHQTSKTKRRRAKTFPFIFRRRDSCTNNEEVAIGCLYDARSARWPHGSEEMALEFSKMFIDFFLNLWIMQCTQFKPVLRKGHLYTTPIEGSRTSLPALHEISPRTLHCPRNGAGSFYELTFQGSGKHF